MAGGNKAPASIAEGYASILQALANAMTAPDAGPVIPFLIDMQKAVAGQMQKGNQPQKPPGGGQPPGGPPGAGGPPPGGGGGMSLGALQGQPQGQPPGPGGSGGPSTSGASQEDIRRMIGAQAGTPG